MEPIFKDVLLGKYSDIIVEKEELFPPLKDGEKSNIPIRRFVNEEFSEKYNKVFDSIFESIEKEVVDKYKDKNFSRNHAFSLKSNLCGYITEFNDIIRFIKVH